MNKTICWLLLGTGVWSIGACTNPPALKTGLGSQPPSGTNAPALVEQAQPVSARTGSTPDTHPNSAAPTNRWPDNGVAQRDFRVAAIYPDDKSNPRKLWMFSIVDGKPRAMEFFTGEQVADVQMQNPRPSDSCLSYASFTFTDTEGHKYLNARAFPSCVDPDEPNSYAGTSKGKEGEIGHDVWLGGHLFNNVESRDHGVYTTKTIPIDSGLYFKSEPTCEGVVYVARTQASTYRDSEEDFIPRTRILADYSRKKHCWNTRPVHSANLQDNTLFLATEDRAFRISSDDLTPVGSAPSLRMIDVKEK